MSKVVGHRWVRYGNSDEASVPVTCCEESKWKMLALLELDSLMRKVNSYLNPQSSGGFVIVHGNVNGFAMNYCPVCGDKYPEEKKQ